MRLIDADALIDNMEGNVTTMSVCLTTIEARAKGEMKRTCIADVANAPTIDAIPVGWLKHRLMMAQKHGSAHPEQAIRYVLWLWEQQKDGEQEAHGT